MHTRCANAGCEPYSYTCPRCGWVRPIVGDEVQVACKEGEESHFRQATVVTTTETCLTVEVEFHGSTTPVSVETYRVWDASVATGLPAATLTALAPEEGNRLVQNVHGAQQLCPATSDLTTPSSPPSAASRLCMVGVSATPAVRPFGVPLDRGVDCAL